MQIRQQQVAPKPAKAIRHWLIKLVGILAMVILFVCSLARTTILNEHYMAREIDHTEVSEQLKNDVNASLASYGIDNDIVTEKQASKLLKQAVHQVYRGETIHLDFDDVLENLEGQTTATLSNFGVPSSVIKDLPTESLNTQLSSSINSRINGEEIQEVESELKLARALTLCGLIASIVILLLIVIIDWFSQMIVSDFKWIVLIGALLNGGLLLIAKPIAMSFAQDYASYQQVIMKICQDVFKTGWQIVIVEIVLAIVLLIISLSFHHRKA